MKINGDLKMMDGTKTVNFTLDSGPAFPVQPNTAKMFWLTKTAGKNLPGFYAHDGSKWVPVTLSGPLYFSGNSDVPLLNARIWTGSATTTSGRWSVAIPAGIFTKILHASAHAGTTDATANGSNFASIDYAAMTITKITGSCIDSDPAGGGLLQSDGQFSPNGTTVQVYVLGQ